MRTVGRRKAAQIRFSASAELLLEGIRFNDEMHRLPTGGQTRVRKGVYFFRNAADADRQYAECVAVGMAAQAQERARWTNTVVPPPSTISRT